MNFVEGYWKNDKQKASAYVAAVKNQLEIADIHADAQITAASIYAAGQVTNTGLKQILELLTPEQKQKTFKFKPFRPNKIMM